MERKKSDLLKGKSEALRGRSESPDRKYGSLKRNSESPERKSRAFKRKSESPNRKSRSFNRNSESPDKKSRSPNRKLDSLDRKLGTLKRKLGSPDSKSRSPKLKSESPDRKSKSRSPNRKSKRKSGSLKRKLPDLIPVKMHPRNIYNEKLDFIALGEKFPAFKNILKFNNQGKAHLNFKDPQVLRILCEVLLERDFKLKVEIPGNYLVPRLPARLNYILWIEDLLQNVPEEQRKNICGVDIGCGPVAIYCLLGHMKNNWKMKGTDISTRSIAHAKRTIEKNKLEKGIDLVLVDGSKVFDKELFKDDFTFSFTMCNPPFFSSEEEAKGLKRRKNAKRARPPPHASPTGFQNELIVEGGELSFIEKQIKESLKLKSTVWFYTTLIGVKAHLRPLVKRLEEEKIKYTTTEFCQGRTMRWGLAWSFTQNFPKE